MAAHEVNFDSLVGLTHFYGGLAYGNKASMAHQFAPSNPKLAALQGLEKMKTLHDLGFKQGIFPPHERPHLPTLRKLGFTGTASEIIKRVSIEAPHLLGACSSAAAMWTANSATVSPSSDTADQLVHFTPANLCTHFHRAMEAPFTARLLKKVFPNPTYFQHHDPLISSLLFADEGAANHTRFCTNLEKPGLHLFVFGREGFEKESTHYPARQTQAASEAISRLHQLHPSTVLLAQQNPAAIDAGVFHNDVIAVGSHHVFIYHEKAFVNTPAVIEKLQRQFLACCQQELILIKVTEEQLSLEEVVSSYFFNSQLLYLAPDQMLLLLPEECRLNPRVQLLLDKILHNPTNPIQSIQYAALRESMRNGGGPACLRLRVVLNEQQQQATHAGIFFTVPLYEQLKEWIKRYYRDCLILADLADPALLVETQAALDQLTQLLNLGSLYSFQ